MKEIAAMADEVTALDLGVPTYEIEVVCGPYCQGGSTKAKCCPYPEFTAAEDVWVKGSDVAALCARVAQYEGGDPTPFVRELRADRDRLRAQLEVAKAGVRLLGHGQDLDAVEVAARENVALHARVAELENIERALRYLLIEAEAMLCDERAGGAANDCARRIIAALNAKTRAAGNKSEVRNG
jgi:hypothetical protein